MNYKTPDLLYVEEIIVESGFAVSFDSAANQIYSGTGDSDDEFTKPSNL